MYLATVYILESVRGCESDNRPAKILIIFVILGDDYFKEAGSLDCFIWGKSCVYLNLKTYLRSIPSLVK